MARGNATEINSRLLSRTSQKCVTNAQQR